MVYLSIDFITLSSKLRMRLRLQRLLSSAARTDSDHAATAASAWTSAVEAASQRMQPLVRKAYAQLSELCDGKAWGGSIVWLPLPGSHADVLRVAQYASGWIRFSLTTASVR